MARLESFPTKPPVLADIPERRQLRSLRGQIEVRTDEIASLDLEIELLRDQLAAFEAEYGSRLASEHHSLRRVSRLTRHMERWADLLRRQPADEAPKRIQRIDARRQREVTAQSPPRTKTERRRADKARKQQPSRPQEPAERLKAVYRELARRFHPDLARTEEERLRVSKTMARVNALYRAGDLERLLLLNEQARGTEIEDPELSLEEELEVLGSRREWLDAVLRNLQEEREALERSSTCELWRNVQQAAAAGRDLLAELKEGLQTRVAASFADVRAAVDTLEAEVNRYNRETMAGHGLERSQRRVRELERIFDPYADKRMVRLGLEQLSVQNVSRPARELAEWIEKEGPGQPAVLRLILFAYASELSPFPLVGLESYEDLALRLRHLGVADETAMALEQALVEADDLVEYGVRRSTGGILHMGLRFRSELLREAVPVALQALAVRRTFKSVLGVLGEHVDCAGCARKVFAVPLYRTRGLDDLRASVCPLCGETLSSYWMPRGKDVQAVLNPTFLDYEIVTEWSFRLAKTTIAMQLTPQQVEILSLSELKRRFVADVFGRYDLSIERRHVRLHQNGKRVVERTLLEDLDSAEFVVRLASTAPLGEGESVEVLRHRIRNRFKGN